MINELKCCVCEKVFYGPGNKKYCGPICKNIIRRKKREEKNKKSDEERRKDANRKYYLKSKHLLTNKYKREHQEFLLKEKDRTREVKRAWDKNNKAKLAEYRRRTKERNRKWFDEYKKTLKCGFCGYNKCIGSLDFHHKNPKDKKFHIGRGIGLRYNKERILKEIEKCFVLCSNCHRELHYLEEQEKVKDKREAFLKIINTPKKICYKIVEEELEKKWVKELKGVANSNLNKFGGNQHTTLDNKVSKRVDLKKAVAKRVELGIKTVCRAIQIYNRGTEEQKERARSGKNSIMQIWRELEPIRYSKKKRKVAK